MNGKRRKRNEYSNEERPRGTRAKRPPPAITPETLRTAGLFYLQRFAVNTERFRVTMTIKVKKSCAFHRDQDYEACLVMLEALIRSFEDAGLLNDTAYTQASVNSMRRQGGSKRAIAAKLGARGLPETLVKDTLESHDISTFDTQAEAELHAALLFARRKRLGPVASPDHPGRTQRSETTEKTQEKVYAAFGRAGFSFDTARRVMEMAPEEAAQRKDKSL